jgi:hypothetical protein
MTAAEAQRRRKLVEQALYKLAVAPAGGHTHRELFGGEAEQWQYIVLRRAIDAGAVESVGDRNYRRYTAGKSLGSVGKSIDENIVSALLTPQPPVVKPHAYFSAEAAPLEPPAVDEAPPAANDPAPGAPTEDPAAPRPRGDKTSQADLHRRYAAVETWLAEGVSYRDIVANVMRVFDASERTAKAYIAMAQARSTESVEMLSALVNVLPLMIDAIARLEQRQVDHGKILTRLLSMWEPESK